MNHNMNLRYIGHLCESISTAIQPTGGKQHELRRHAEMLFAAFSEMAIRNVLSSLLLRVKACKMEISDIRHPHYLALREARGHCDTLIARIKLELPKYNVDRQRYKQVACFGYKIALPDYKVSSKVDDVEDMKARCADLKKAIRAAYALADQKGRDYNRTKHRMLKVFVAPEFFFRGRHGAYDHSVVAGTAAINDGGRSKAAQPGIVETMAEEIDLPIYKDWLFVLGTAVAATRYSRVVCLHPGCQGTVVYKKGLSLKPEMQNKTVPECGLVSTHPVGEKTVVGQVDNVAIICKEGATHTVAKELISGIDYQKNQVTVDGTKLPVAVESWLQDSKFQDERMGGCIFSIDGITIGVEVCLDHDTSKRRPSAGRLDHAANIQLQIIPSYGMNIRQLRTIEGGVVFNVDGQTPHVEAIGGDTSSVQSTKFEGWTFTPTDFEAIKSSGSDQQKLNQLNNQGLGDWKNSGAPAISAAVSNGAVVMYGPYRLPSL